MVNDQHDSLWQRYKDFRTLEDRDQLVLTYQHLIRRLKPKQAHLSAWFDEDDFAQAGAIGLCEAIERYDPDTGVPFEKYAAKRIAGAMTDATRKDLDWAPRRTRQHLDKITTFHDQFVIDHNREPNAIEVAESLGIGKEVAGELMALTTAHEKGALPLLPEVAEEIVAEVTESDWWRNAIRDMCEPEKSVIALHYLEGLAVEDVAAALGFGAVKVHQVKKRAIENLRASNAEVAA